MARLRTVMTITITSAIALAISACGKSEDGKTPFAPPAGKAREIFWAQSVEINVKMAAMGMDDTTTQTTKMNLLATPGEAAADGSINLETTFDYVTAETSGASNPAMGGADPNASNKALAKGLMGKSFSATVDAGGNVMSLSGTDALLNGVLAEMGGLEYPAELGGDDLKAVMENSMKQQFGDVAMTNMVEDIVVPRSLESLEPGTTWTRTGSVDFGLLPTNFTYTYTVTEQTDATVIVEQASTFKLDPNGVNMIEVLKLNQMVKNLGEMTLDVSGTGSASYTIDRASGWADAYDGTITLTGKLGLGAMSADINITITQDFVANFQ